MSNRGRRHRDNIRSIKGYERYFEDGVIENAKRDASDAIYTDFAVKDPAPPADTKLLFAELQTAHARVKSLKRQRALLFLLLIVGMAGTGIWGYLLGTALS